MAVTTPGALPTVASRPRAFWQSRDCPLLQVEILSFILLVAVFADLLAPYDPQIGSLARRYRPPFWQDGGSIAYPLGTDHVGRDVLSRLIFGARVSVVVGVTAVLVAGTIGTFLG